MWLEFVRYVLLVWGLIYLVTQSAIFAPIRATILHFSRFAGILVFCPSCSGFWIGICVALLGAYTQGLGWIPSWIESGVIAMPLGHIWGVYFGDPTLYQDTVVRSQNHESSV